MALSQALSTGITGLMTHQKAMDNIGNNLANVNTVGFKKGIYQFSTLLEQTLRGGMSADNGTGRGSVNPLSLGLGAQTGSINKVFTQGPIENTGNPNDMAIDGNGFFVLKMENGYAYTRAGSFYRGEDGTLMAGEGLYVQGTMAVKNSDGSISIPQDAKLQNIVIPIGTTGGHSQTTKAQFSGNLDSRLEVSNGLQLFGGTSYPTVSSLQSWMSKNFNGGDPIKNTKVDDTWNSLEKKTYVTADSLSPAPTHAYYAKDASGKIVDVGSLTGLGYPAKIHTSVPAAGDSLEELYPGYTAMVEEVKTINGGNVQTSAAYGVKVPAFDAGVANGITYPQWFYQASGASVAYDEIVKLNNGIDSGVPFTYTDPNGTATTFNTEAEVFAYIWPQGISGDNATVTSLPRQGEIFPATLNTPLENLYYYKGNAWVQPFASVKNGDEIGVSFKKGDSQLKATFVYNKPVGPEPTEGQVAIDREKSYTLEHFLKFLAGDVDEPSVACARITPAMFGAPVTAEYPDGNVNDPAFNRNAYEKALEDVALAKQDYNMDSVGGVMGLLSIPPQISDANGGLDNYDSPMESAGAYSRTGVQEVRYERWDSATNKMVEQKMSSFNVSLVSNLGVQNALSDISISFNNVSHDSMFSSEKEYSAPQGGSSVVSIDFYDSLGNPKTATMRMTMVDQSDNFTTWRWYADCADDTDFPWQADPQTGELNSSLSVGTGLIRFDKNGNFVKGAEYSETQGIIINQANSGVNDPIVLRILNGLSSSSKQDLDLSELTCSATGNSLKLSSQNGRPPGTLNDFTVSLDGVIQGIYSNGNVVAIARIGLAMIPNENGLIAAGSNLFYTGPASGDARYGHANLGGNGKIRHQQLESSNVDLSEEFTKLISTERGFQANSRTITTADEMITELLNLKR